MTNLGASLGTALVGAVLIATLTTGLVRGIQASSASPAHVKTQATTQLSGGVPFISDSDLRAQLEAANVPAEQADAVEQANSDARFTALRTSLLVVALVAIAALFGTGMIPVKAVGQPAGSVPADGAADGSPDDGSVDSSAEILDSSTSAESAGP